MLTIVTSSFPIKRDGSEAAGSFVADVADELSTHTFVRVVAPGSRETKESYGTNVEVFRYPAPSCALSSLRLWHPSDVRLILRVLRDGLKMTRSAACGSNGILACWGLPCGYWAQVAARENSIPYSVWLLGSDIWTLGRIPIVRRTLARVVSDSSNAYADGFVLANDARKLSGKDIAFLPSARKLGGKAEPRRARQPFRFLFLGRWHPNKGIDLLLDALHLLSDDDWRGIEVFELQGGGPLDVLVHSRAKELQARGRPIKVGAFLEKEDAEAAIARSDWVVIPSRIESIPVVFSDAMKMNRPIVATPVGDLPRLIREWGCGVECNSTSAADIAQGLRVAIRCENFPDVPDALMDVFSLSKIAERILEDFREKI